MFINFRVNIHYVQYLKSGPKVRPYTVFPVISFVLTCRTRNLRRELNSGFSYYLGTIPQIEKERE